MRNEHKTNVLIIRNGIETARACEKVVRVDNKAVEVHTGSNCSEVIEAPAEVLLIGDTGKCWHRFNLTQ